MAALDGEGDAQKLRFGPWLLNAVSSGLYRGLCWIDADRRIFRIPWKHNARKDVTSSDVEIFKAWAKASGRYEGNAEDPAKWKTNFRCALRSTHMFTLLEDRSKCNNDPHKVYAVASAILNERGFGGPVSDAPLQQPQPQLLLNHRDLASENTPPDSAEGAAAPALMQEDLDVLQSILQHCNISALGSQTPFWAHAGDALPEDALLLSGPGGCLPVQPFQDWRHLEEQGTCSPPESLLLTDQPLPGGGCGQDGAGGLSVSEECAVPVPSPGEQLLFQPANPAPPPLAGDTGELPPILDITIYYRGKVVYQEQVTDSQWVLAYQPLDPAVAEQRLVLFPSPESLVDPRQRHYTEDLLGVAGLRLEQRAGQLLATRLKKCKVFWALSQQLEGGEPPLNLLHRDQETTIFDFSVFCTELRDFRDSRRERSPDFTIFLCFGQCFSSTKPKESKLILVKGCMEKQLPQTPSTAVPVCCCSWCPSSASTGMSRCSGKEPPPSTVAMSACSSLTPSTSLSLSSNTTCRQIDTPFLCSFPGLCCLAESFLAPLSQHWAGFTVTEEKRAAFASIPGHILLPCSSCECWLRVNTPQEQPAVEPAQELSIPPKAAAKSLVVGKAFSSDCTVLQPPGTSMVYCGGPSFLQDSSCGPGDGMMAFSNSYLEFLGIVVLYGFTFLKFCKFKCTSV